jgi:hypothetical protein
VGGRRVECGTDGLTAFWQKLSVNAIFVEISMASENQLLPQLITGVTVAMLALVDTLDKQNVIRIEDYRAAVARLWGEMPYEDAAAGSGFFLDRLLGVLDDMVRRKQGP